MWGKNKIKWKEEVEKRIMCHPIGKEHEEII